MVIDIKGKISFEGVYVWTEKYLLGNVHSSVFKSDTFIDIYARLYFNYKRL